MFFNVFHNVYKHFFLLKKVATIFNAYFVIQITNISQHR